MSKVEEENFEYDQREFEIERGESLKLHNYNLKTQVDFLFTLDPQVSHSLDNTRGGGSSYSKDISHRAGSF
jgi:hypothetical protein